jgi:DNA-binding NarL/FixJ family response regulator
MQVSNPDRPDVDRSASSRSGTAHQRRILIVEDEALVALDVCEQAEALGLNVCGIVATLDGALRLAQTPGLDLAVVDVTLGQGEDGVEIAERLQREFGIRIVFLTAHTDLATRTRIEAIRPAAYLFKPYAIDLLRDALLDA